MPGILSCSRIILLAAVAGSFASIVTPVEAQQPSANPSPAAAPTPAASTPAATPAPAPAAPPWAQARPDEAVNANLAPVVPPPIATASDKLPLSKLKLPKNFHIEVFASGMPQARSTRDYRKNWHPASPATAPTGNRKPRTSPHSALSSRNTP